MIYFGKDWNWDGVELQAYKDRPGSWSGITRRNLSDGADCSFEVRYFEIAQDGYSSFEKHQHEHCVMVVRGKGEVRLGDEWTEVSEQDIVRVEALVPHQFRNPNQEPFGILCIVDKERDRPVLLDDDAKDSVSEAWSSCEASKT